MEKRAVAAVRFVVNKLSSISHNDLPEIIPLLAKALADGKNVLSADSTQRVAASDSALLRKLKTHVSRLLNSKINVERWAAIVLIKAIVEVGGQERLKDCRPWIQSLRDVLLRIQFPITQKLCLVTLTKIFLLMHDSPALVRDIAIPELPQYIGTCVSLLTSKSSIPQTKKGLREVTPAIFESLAKLLPLYSTIFRPYSSSLRDILIDVLSLTNSYNGVQGPAQRLFALLHFSAARTNSNDPMKEWSNDFDRVLVDVHEAANKIFRGVHEVWRSSSGILPNSTSLDGDVSCLGPTQLKLPGFTGINQGAARIKLLLELAISFTLSKSADTIEFPLGKVIDLIARVLLVTSPSSNESADDLQLDERVSADEKEALWVELPGIHVSTMKFANAVCERFGHSAMCVHRILLEHIQWTFEREQYRASLRTIVYTTCSTILQTSGLALPSHQIRDLKTIMQTCCKDILPPVETQNTKYSSLNDQNNTFLNNDKNSSQSIEPQSEIQESARNLLQNFLYRVPAQHIPPPLRKILDETSILADDKNAMLASSLNPPVLSHGGRAESSLLPFLAKGHPQNMETECLIRPRMPFVTTSITLHPSQIGDEEVMMVDTEQAISLKSDVYLDEHRDQNVLDAINRAPDTSDVIQSPSTDDHNSERRATHPQNDPAPRPYENEISASGINQPSPTKRHLSPSDATGPLKKKYRVMPTAENDEEELHEARANEGDIPKVKDGNPSPLVQNRIGAHLDLNASSGMTRDQPLDATVDGSELDDSDHFEIPPLTLDSESDEEDVGE